VKKSELLKCNFAGGFTPEVFETLRSHPALVSELALEILNQHFPQTFYADLLDAGLPKPVRFFGNQNMDRRSMRSQFRMTGDGSPVPEKIVLCECGIVTLVSCDRN
jgi:hypothetical protein